MLKRVVTFSLSIVLLLILPLTSHAASNPAVTSWKDWKVTFNQEVNKNSGLELVSIQSADNTKHPVSVTISADSKKFVVNPKKPYLFGKKYTLVIPKEVKSAQGKTLHEEATKTFSVTSDYVESIETNYTSLLTDVIVTKKKNAPVTKVELQLDGTTDSLRLKRENNHFSRGFLGLQRGQAFELHLYDEERLLEVLYYEVN